MRQSNKVNTIKTTKPVVSRMACEVGSTAEDTAGWSTDGTGNKTDSGRLALSTSADTTITGCETAYPELWARAPSAWQSGSNLIVPRKGASSVGDWITYTPTLTGFTASANEGKYRVIGDCIHLRARAVISSVSSALQISLPSGFTADSTKYPLAAINSFYGSSSEIGRAHV